MIDLKQYRAHPQQYIEWARAKGVDVDRAKIDSLDTSVRDLKQQLDDLWAERNQLTTQVQEIQKSGWDSAIIIDRVRVIKEQMQTLQADYDVWYVSLQQELARVPNPPSNDTPIGKDDTENVVAAYIGEKRVCDFQPKPHWEILEAKGYLDSERAVKISGSRFIMLKGMWAKLEFAIMQWAMEKLINKGFIFTVVPQLVREQAMYTTGFLPNDAMNLYRVNPKSSTEQTDREEDDLWLIGTSEVPLVSQHIDEVLDAEQLPLRYCGFSACYRREAGTYGKDTKGLIRVHQFEKVEMVSFVKPEDSVKEHELLREIEEEIFTELGIHFQRIHICSGDLGAPAAKKYDLEAWFPGIGAYKEVTSTSNTTDFQTRRGNIKFKDGERREYVHSLNGTALALGRALAAIVETYQTAEGDVIIPEVLRKWMGVEKI